MSLDTLVALQRQITALQRDVARLAAQERIRYATGTWTPAFTGSIIAGTFTYTQQTGRWRRVGDTILYWFDVGISAITVAPTGNMRITGLPTTALTYGFTTLSAITQIDITANKFLTAVVTSSQSYIQLYEATDNGANALYPAANFTNASARLIGGGAYLAST